MSKKRCYYETMELERSCTEDEIKSAYRRLARIWHPDKNIHQIVLAEATFKEIRAAYEVLSDPHERAWYDSHREEILAGGDGTGSTRNDGENLWQYFSAGSFSGYSDNEGGFYKVFSEAFESINQEERLMEPKAPDAPKFGNSKSSYVETIRPFYNFWVNFTSARSFAWKDVYNTTQAPNREVRRVMEKENKKERDKARREFNELVRRLAEFARKKDVRVLAWAKEQAALKIVKEAQDKEAKEKRAAEVRVKQQAAKEAQQAQLDAIDLSGMDLRDLMSEKDLKRHKHLFKNDGENADEEEEEEEDSAEEFYCPACKKVFKSDKQFKNHENSKKHKEMAAKLRKELMEEDEAAEAAMAAQKNKNNAKNNNNVNSNKSNANADVRAEDDFSDDDEQFMEDLETIRHADDDLVHTINADEEGIDVDASSDDEDLDILADLEQYRLREATEDKKSSEEKVSPGAKNSKASEETNDTTEKDENDEEVEENENDDDDMLSMMASAKMAKSRFSFADEDDDDNEEDEDNVEAEENGSKKKSFNFADFEASLPASSRSSPSPATPTLSASDFEMGGGKKKRRRAEKGAKGSSQAAAPVPAPEPEPEYERGAKGKKGGKGKKGAKAAAQPVHENSCRTCGASFASKSALHTHLKETKHAIAN